MLPASVVVVTREPEVAGSNLAVGDFAMVDSFEGFLLFRPMGFAGLDSSLYSMKSGSLSQTATCCC